MIKAFLITVDTEGDNLWNWNSGNPISTENSRYIPKFQEMCERYDYIPTYLTNYEMALDDRWVEYGKYKQSQRKCEIGLHIHAWNTPPLYNISNIYGGNPYITEYPKTIIHNKISYLVDFLSDRFNTNITSARSGRWATDQQYFSALAQNGIFVDCSVTPGVNHSIIPGQSVRGGNDYRKANPKPSIIYPNVIEIPMTTRCIRWKSEGSMKHKLKTMTLGDVMWFRPLQLSEKYLKTIITSVQNEGSEYLEFMIHSSELMPEGSPYFISEDDIKRLYDIIEWLFYYLKGFGIKGYGISDFANRIRNTLI